LFSEVKRLVVGKVFKAAGYATDLFLGEPLWLSGKVME
jgi:hypothetical protein